MSSGGVKCGFAVTCCVCYSQDAFREAGGFDGLIGTMKSHGFMPTVVAKGCTALTHLTKGNAANQVLSHVSLLHIFCFPGHVAISWIGHVIKALNLLTY